METPNETIWYDDVGSLFTKRNFGSVVPTASMTFAEQLNAVLRFAIYYAAIMFAIKQAVGSDRARACDPLDEDVRDSIDENFRAGALVAQDDIYGRNTGARQFYTNPVTTGVNDQKGYAEWLYGAVNCSGKQVRPPPHGLA